MEVEFLTRLQFAFTIAFHYIYPPLSIGLGMMLIFLEGMYLYTAFVFRTFRERVKLDETSY